MVKIIQDKMKKYNIVNDKLTDVFFFTDDEINSEIKCKDKVEDLLKSNIETDKINPYIINNKVRIFTNILF